MEIRKVEFPFGDCSKNMLRTKQVFKEHVENKTRGGLWVMLYFKMYFKQSRGYISLYEIKA
jgi:hypothetical protein